MKCKDLDSAIASEMKGVVISLEDHDLGAAESQMEFLSKQINMPASDCIREEKLKNLRQRLDSGIRHIRRAAPVTALIRAREALSAWLK